MASPVTTAPAELSDLVHRFRANREIYRRPAYNETQLRREFLDPFFGTLGWDVANVRGTADAYKDVVHEDSVKVFGATKAPDYAFRTGGSRRFFVEAKRPSKDLNADPAPAFQLRRYTWSAKLPVGVLTDFEELVIYDGRIEPDAEDSATVARLEYLRFEDYEERWNFLTSTLSKQAVLEGSLEGLVSAASTRRRYEVDAAFLRELERWRGVLASAIVASNASLSVRQVNFAVQRTIDRIVFLRICEDRGIEPYGQLRRLIETRGLYSQLLALYARADERYNSGLFHFRAEPGREEEHDTLTPGLEIPDEPLRSILERLYYPQSPYEFSVLPADILGQVYEQFLGRLIAVDAGGKVAVEEKPEVRKAGGVYYTPTFVVEYIVQQALGPLLDGRTPAQVRGEGRKKGVRPIRILDPACGSGSFLIAAYQLLLDWYHASFVAEDPEQWTKGRSPRLYLDSGGNWRLTGTERQRILLAHIFGVDIDPQAVEVTKLSLLLKVLEGESLEAVNQQMALIHERALPDLGSNIKCGNSLISSEFYVQYPSTLLDEEAVYRVNAFDWEDEFPEIFRSGGEGFDAVIGNPPYVLLQDGIEDPEELEYFRDAYRGASYKVDTYHLFIEAGLRLTSDAGGRLSMITPSNFLTNNYLLSLRRLMLDDAQIERIDVVDKGVFEKISVDNAIFLLRAGSTTRGSFPVAHLGARGRELTERSIIGVDAEKVRATEHSLFTGSSEASSAGLWDRILEGSRPLGEIAYVNFGKQLRDRKQYTRDVIAVDAAEDVPQNYRPCYTGRDVKRYSVDWNGLACLDDEGARRGGCWDPDRQNRRNKLLTRQIGRTPEFALDPLGYQCLNTIFMVNVADDEFEPVYVLALLNSNLIKAYWVDRYYDQRRTFPKIKGTYLKELPIWPIGSLEEQVIVRIRGLVHEISSARTSVDAGTDQERLARGRRLETLESQLDDLVFDAYGVDDPADREALRALASPPDPDSDVEQPEVATA